MKIIRKNNNFELVVLENALLEDYEKVFNYLMKELNLTEIEEIDDFDTHYQLLNYKEKVIILYYNNFLGISIYFEDPSVDLFLQRSILTEFLDALRGLL